MSGVPLDDRGIRIEEFGGLLHEKIDHLQAEDVLCLHAFALVETDDGIEVCAEKAGYKEAQAYALTQLLIVALKDSGTTHPSLMFVLNTLTDQLGEYVALRYSRAARGDL